MPSVSSSDKWTTKEGGKAESEREREAAAQSSRGATNRHRDARADLIASQVSTLFSKQRKTKTRQPARRADGPRQPASPPMQLCFIGSGFNITAGSERW